jgi:hypothetical protein
VELISQEVRKQLASSTQRPMSIAAKTGIRLAGGRVSESCGVVGVVQWLFGQGTGVGTTASAEGNYCMCCAMWCRRFQGNYVCDGHLLWRLHAYFHQFSVAHNTTGAVKPLQFHLSFQSRVGPVKWIGPYTDFKIRELAQEKKVKSCAGVLLAWFA